MVGEILAGMECGCDCVKSWNPIKGLVWKYGSVKPSGQPNVCKHTSSGLLSVPARESISLGAWQLQTKKDCGQLYMTVFRPKARHVQLKQCGRGHTLVKQCDCPHKVVYILYYVRLF